MAPLSGFVPPEPSTARAALLGDLAARIVATGPDRRVLIAIDGVDGAGKTVLADELAPLVQQTREVHRTSVDGFHLPRAQRYARGRTAESFYHRSYDYAALSERLLRPFRAGEDFVTAVWSVADDHAVDQRPQRAGPSAVLLVDGIFLHRPELRQEWDAALWVEVPFAVSVPRGNARFGPLDSQAADPESAQNRRYVGGQGLYLADVDPARLATWVVDNTDLDRPFVREFDAEPAERASGAGALA